MTVARVTQEAAEVLLAGSPKARVTQESAEVLLAGSPKARVTQVALEALVSVEEALGRRRPLYVVESARMVGPAPLQSFYRFDATGVEEEWIVPAGVTSIRAYAFGGAGGGGVYAAGLESGAGGYSRGTFSVTPGETLKIRVGKGGQGGQRITSNAGGLGGWPGGGSGAVGDVWGGGGGGYTGVFRSDNTPIIIAGGGGGVGGWSTHGGAGGGTAGQDETGGIGTGGTQSAGGASGGGMEAGSYLQGARADNGNRTVATGNDAAGGGGGYYGGGSRNGDGGAAAGGSGYIGGCTDAETLTGNRKSVHASAPLTVNGETVSPRAEGVFSASGAVNGNDGNDGVLWFEIL